MAHIMQVALLVMGALMMSLTYCSAQDDQALVTFEEDQTLVSEVAHRALLQKPIYDPNAENVENSKHKPAKPYCGDRAGYTKCYSWKYKGWCKNKYFGYYSVPYYWCPKTCSKCSCYDQPGYEKLCKKWYSQGYCKKGYFYTYYKIKSSVYSVLCPYTCKYCTKSGPKY